MTLKDRIQFLKTPEDVDAFLAGHPKAAIFKAGTCHKTQETFGNVQQNLEPREDVALGIIRVVEWRPASDHVASLTGIGHESPQFILFKDSKAVFDRDNWDITAEDVEAGLTENLAQTEVALEPQRQ